MKKFYLIIIILIIALNFQSCKNKEDMIYQNEIILNNNLWAKNEVIILISISMILQKFIHA
jgi:hypothetical protein